MDILCCDIVYLYLCTGSEEDLQTVLFHHINNLFQGFKCNTSTVNAKAYHKDLRSQLDIVNTEILEIEPCLFINIIPVHSDKFRTVFKRLFLLFKSFDPVQFYITHKVTFSINSTSSPLIISASMEKERSRFLVFI